MVGLDNDLDVQFVTSPRATSSGDRDLGHLSVTAWRHFVTRQHVSVDQLTEGIQHRLPGANALDAQHCAARPDMHQMAIAAISSILVDDNEIQEDVVLDAQFDVHPVVVQLLAVAANVLQVRRHVANDVCGSLGRPSPWTRSAWSRCLLPSASLTANCRGAGSITRVNPLLWKITQRSSPGSSGIGKDITR